MLKFFRVPFALSGTRTPVPDAADPSGFVSYIEGYGADYQRAKTDPLSKNIERDKMNELFFDATNAIGEIQAQGAPDFITSALNGGTPYSYSKNAVVRYTDGSLYVSVANANTAAPTDPTKWVRFDDLLALDGTSSADIIKSVKPMQSYAALRAYAGSATGISITAPGLAGLFYVKAGDVTSVDNGGTIIVDASGRRWFRLFSGLVDVMWFSAIAGGVADNTVPFNAAVAYAKAISTGVKIPGGKFAVNGLVSLLDNVSIFGDGKTATEIYFGASGKFDIAGTLGSQIGRLSIQGIGFTNQGGGAAFALTMRFSTRVLIQDCVFYNTSVSMSAFSYVTIHSCDAFGGQIYADHPTVDSISEALKVLNLNASNYAINVKDTADLMISGCSLLGATSQINVSRGEQPAAFYPPIFITDTVVDSGDNEGILLNGVAPHISGVFVSCGRVGLKSGISMTDCQEGAVTNSTLRYNGQNGLFASACRSMNFTGNTFTDNKIAGASIAASTQLRFVANTFGNAPAWFGGSYPQVDGLVDNPGTCTAVQAFCNSFVGNTGTALFLPSNTCTAVGNAGITTNTVVGDDFRPTTDNAMTLGTAPKRWSVVYAGTGAINTSDQREKEQVRAPTAAETAVAIRLKGLVKTFKFKDAVALKGMAARRHVGWLAQDVIAAFESEGLDAFEYGCCCYDEWEGGDRYSVRENEIQALIASLT